MCMQCVAGGMTYVGGSLGVLQVMKVRARRRRTSGEPRNASAERVTLTPRPDRPAAG